MALRARKVGSTLIADSANRKLTLCNAGQTQPIHFCAKTGETKLLGSQGDTFPLGIMADADYQETELQLAQGDRLLIYTDGVVEAMNAKEEIFGFRRLMDVVLEASSMEADSLLKTVLNKVQAFTGKASQHDDQTLIAISVE